MEWLRFFVVLFRVICCRYRDNVSYLSKKYKLLNNLKYLQQNFKLFEIGMKLYVNYMKIV